MIAATPPELPPIDTCKHVVAPHPISIARRYEARYAPETGGFFDDNEAWLARVLEAGRKSRRLAFKGAAAAHAVVLVSGLEGAMLVCRSTSGSRRFEETARRLLASVGA